MAIMTKKQLELVYGSEVANLLAKVISFPIEKDHPRYELAKTVALCVKPYTDLELDTDTLDEDLLFIHSFNSTFGIDLEDMSLSITSYLSPSDKNQTELENIPFSFETLVEKLNQYFGNAQ